MRKIQLLLILELCYGVGCVPSEKISGNADDRPNIILIVGDDMGYSDLGCYGGEIRTPNLDQLANNGLRYTQFYNSARCCPTRASLLTGVYPHQAGIGHMLQDRGTPGYAGDLGGNVVTIAEVLKSAGYSTYMSGKWHVTPYVIDKPDKKNWPRQRGFDRFFGMISGAGSFYDPRSLANDNEYTAPRMGFYATTDFTDYAIHCIEEHPGDDPFFLYLSYTAAHWPMHAPEEFVQKYRGHYDDGWDEVRKERYERMIQMGLISPSWEMTSRDSFITSWDDHIEDREWEIANMEVYAAMVDLMDYDIGRVIDVLIENDKFDNSIILYLQDNGACAEDLSWVRMRDEPGYPQPMDPSELQTEMVPPITRDGSPIKLMKDAWPGPAEGYTAYGLNWANASNTPFREYKHWVHEGGISSPLIVHWPRGIESKGEFRHHSTHLIDIMATCVELAESQYPIQFRGGDVIPFEGLSLVPSFQDLPLNREALFWEHEGNRAVRRGKWKLVSKARKFRAMAWDKYEVLPLAQWELFNMEEDRTENHDLARDYPELVSQMAQEWEKWAIRTGAAPRPQ